MCVVKESKLNGKGVYSQKSYKVGETVLVGKISKRLAENHSHASQIGIDQFILPDEIYRHLNHSCDPNCGIEVNRFGAHSLICRKDIAPGDEVNFDYAMENYTIENFPTSCSCGSTKCRTTISGWKDLPHSLKEEYKSWAAPYLIEIDAVQEVENKLIQN